MLLIVDLEALIGNKQDCHILLRRGAVLHDRPFREPDEMPWPILAIVGLQRPLQDVHTMRAWMRMPWVDGAGRVADQADLHARVRILDQVLAIERAADLFVRTLFPGKRVAVDRCEFDIRHLPIMPGLSKPGNLCATVSECTNIR
jgi:hypothetical protein